MEPIFYREIKWGVSGLVKLIGNMHAALIKRDPKTYRHMYLWIQVHLKREFDRISKDSTSEMLTKTEDIDSTLSLIERQIVQIFGVAESLRAGEIQPGLQYHLGARTDLIAKKAEKLRILISEKASESPEKLSPNSQATQQPKLD